MLKGDIQNCNIAWYLLIFNCILSRTIRLGKADVKLNAMIKNIGKDTAFQTTLLITLPKGISVSYIMLPNRVWICSFSCTFVLLMKIIFNFQVKNFPDGFFLLKVQCLPWLQVDSKLCDEANILPDGGSETKCRDLFIEIKSKKEVCSLIKLFYPIFDDQL